MDLVSLKAAWDAAFEKSKAAPDDAELKAAADAVEEKYNEAVAAEAAKKVKKDESDPEDDSKWDDKTKAYIKRLRDESATHRTKNKDLASNLKAEKERTKAILKAAGIEDESEKPEEKVKALSANNSNLAFRNAVLESAVANGISGDDVEYFEFLVSKAVANLEEGDELSEEEVGQIVAKVKKGKPKANSSVGKDGKEDPKPGASDEISLDQFCRMSITEKSQLYTKSPDVYKALYAEAKAKRKLI